jgi:hypothetical protein
VDGSTALVLDLPGASGVLFGLALAAQGYFPVPLYNAIPRPSIELMIGETSLVDMETIVRALRDATPALSQSSHSPDASGICRGESRGSGCDPCRGNSTTDRRRSRPTFRRPCSAAHGLGGLSSGNRQATSRSRTSPTRGWRPAVCVSLKRLDLEDPFLVVHKPTQFGPVAARWPQYCDDPFGGFGGMVPEPFG